MSSSTLQRYRNDINKFSPNRIPSNSSKRKRMILNCQNDPERPHMISKDLKRPQKASNELKRRKR